MTATGAITPTGDPEVRAAFFLVNDLALVLLRNQLATVLGVDPLAPEGITRWAAEVTTIYTDGAFRRPPSAEPSAHQEAGVRPEPRETE